MHQATLTFGNFSFSRHVTPARGRARDRGLVVRAVLTARKGEDKAPDARRARARSCSRSRILHLARTLSLSRAGALSLPIPL